jgi:dihydrofolate reductase
MGKVFAEITMSVDGFAAGPRISPQHPLGEDGNQLHEWLFKGTKDNPIDQQNAAAFFSSTGAFVIGRRTFDLGINEWGEDGAFGKPCFVLTHRQQEMLVRGSTTFTFVTDGIESAVRQARLAAGEQDVCVMGGANTIQQAINAGLVAELRLHIAPVLLGAGTRLFDQLKGAPITLESTQVSNSSFAVHLRYRMQMTDSFQP